MPNIDRYLANIMSAVYGETVRKSIHDAISAINDQLDSWSGEAVEESVSNWLDEHPEATTTVLDNSIGERKLSDSLKLRTIKDFVTPEMFGAKGDGVTDDTAAIQGAIDSLAHGGVVHLSEKTYKVTSITLKLKTKLKGSGLGRTIIDQINGTEEDCIKIPPSCVCGEISDMSIVGKNNSSANKQCGIHVENVAAVESSLVGGIDIARDNRYEATTPNIGSTYKYLYLHNLLISSFSDGIYFDSCRYAIRVDGIYVYDMKRYGILDTSTDNFFNNLYIERCGSDGLHTTGGNNKWSNIKSIWNNINDYNYDNLEGRGGFILSAENTAAIYVRGDRNTFVNCEAQDNYGHGFLIAGTSNRFVAPLADSNGFARSEGGGVGFIIVAGQHNQIVGGAVDNYAYGKVIDGYDRTNAVYQDYYIRINRRLNFVDITSNYAVNKYEHNNKLQLDGLQHGTIEVTAQPGQVVEARIEIPLPYTHPNDYSIAIVPVVWSDPSKLSFCVKNKAQSYAMIRIYSSFQDPVSVTIDWVAVGLLN